MYTISPHHSPVSRQAIDDDISSVAFRSVTFTDKSKGLHLQSEGGDQTTIYFFWGKMVIFFLGNNEQY